MNSPLYVDRDARDLPFYCRPVPLFFSVWFLMLLTYELRISYTSYPELAPAILLFGISSCSFLLSYFTVRLAYSATHKVKATHSAYRIDVVRLRKFQWICGFVTAAILIYNVKRYGLPPVFGFFGASTFEYGEYGSFKQVLFPAFMAMFITAPLEPAPLRRLSLYCIGPLCGIAYASRGYLLIMFFQLLVMFSLRTRLSKKKIYIIASCTFVAALELSDLIGNGRSSYGSAALIGYMQIKRAYSDWPTAYLWLISYVSSPISNLCWIVRSYRYDHPSTAFMYNLAPGFWHIKGLEAGDLGSSNIVDGVHTYMAKYYLDFSWLGVFGINYIWGIISGCITVGGRLTRNFLTSSVLLACLGFIFFADFLTFLLIVVELALVAWGQQYFTIRQASPLSGVQEAP